VPRGGFVPKGRLKEFARLGKAFELPSACELEIRYTAGCFGSLRYGLKCSAVPEP